MLKQMIRLLALSVALVAAAGAAPSSLPVAPASSLAAVGNCTPDPSWGTVDTSYAAAVLTLVNNHRTAMGLTALKTSTTLTNSAVWKSRHMSYYQYMAHDDPAPPVARTVPQRLDACGYPSSTTGWGENIAYGYATPSAVMTGWLNSPGHKANIENPSYRTIGIGVAKNASGTYYWTQDFGTQDVTSTSPPPPPPPPPPPASPPPPPPPPTTSVTAVPSATTIYTGTVRAGSAASLGALDGATYQVNSVSGRTSWYARIPGVPNSLKSLSVTYNGSDSAGCTQVLAIWNSAGGYWLSLGSRSAGPTPATTTATVGGTLGNYVTGTTGIGDVYVLAQCTGASTTAFFTSADLVRVGYTN